MHQVLVLELYYTKASALAYFSKPFGVRHHKLKAYERELIGLVQAVHHWRPYLWGRRFLVRTDHYSLKFMLDQWMSTVPQHQWISKLFGFDFTVEYMPGRLNKVADALSHCDSDIGCLSVLSSPSFSPFDDIRQDNRCLPAMLQLRQRI